MRRIPPALLTHLYSALLCLAPLCLACSAAASPADSPGTLCRQASDSAARAHGVPASLMAAIGQVESGRRDPTGTTRVPWPWTVDADGQGSFYPTKAQAIEAVQALQARGVRSIDVGCMQVNLMHHPTAFADLAQAFDPAANADYAARFLHELYGQTGTWPKAAAMYHSSTPELAADYQRKVMAAWPQADRLAAATRPGLPASAGMLDASGFVLPRPMTAGRIMPLAPHTGQMGRGLASYRAAPVMLRIAGIAPLER